MRSASGILGTVVIMLVLAALLTLQVVGPWAPPPSEAVDPWPLKPPAPAPARVHLGVTTLAMARSSYRRWQISDLNEVNAFEQRARRHADIVMWFADWKVRNFSARQAAAVALRGSRPEISWEPWDSSKGPRRPQPYYRLRRIIRGDFDGYVRRWARQIKAYGKPVRLRFAHEMNGRWYAWSEGFNGNRPGEFARAWRRVHWLFAAEGAHNVEWVWSPVAGAPRADLYPGDRQVDVLAVSGFNGGTKHFRRRWRSFPTAFGETLDWVHALDRTKPVELSEIGSAEEGGSKALWITGMFDEIKRRPYVRALVWFDVRKETDWRISSSRAAQESFARGIKAVQ